MSLCEQALRMKVVGRSQTHLRTQQGKQTKDIVQKRKRWKSGWIPFNWRFLPQ